MKTELITEIDQEPIRSCFMAIVLYQYRDKKGVERERERSDRSEREK